MATSWNLGTRKSVTIFSMRGKVALATLSFFLLPGIVGAYTPSISGAPGNVEYWLPLNSTPRSPVTFIVTHDAWEQPYGAGRKLAREQSGGRVGAEWWVMLDGTIIHTDRERRTGHCGTYRAPGVGGDCNGRSVGIEFEGRGHLTGGQVHSGLALIRFLQERYCIQPTNVAAHRKAPNEGVLIMQAAQKMGYKPSCTGTVQEGNIPEDVITDATKNAQNTPVSLYDAYRSNQGEIRQQPGYSSSYTQPTVTGSQYVFGQPGGSAGAPVSSGGTYAPLRPSAFSSLQQIAIPDMHGNEGDTVTEAESKKTIPLKNTDKIVVISSNASSTSTVGPGYQSTTSAVTYAVITTFGPAKSEVPSLAEAMNKNQIVELLANLKTILSRFLLRLSPN